MACQGVIKTSKVKLEPLPPTPQQQTGHGGLQGGGGGGTSHLGDRLTKGSPKILKRNSPEGQEMGRSISTDKVRGPGTQGGAVQSRQTPLRLRDPPAMPAALPLKHA